MSTDREGMTQAKLCHLLQLPPEIRLQIYGYILDGPYHVRLVVNVEPKVMKLGAIVNTPGLPPFPAQMKWSDRTLATVEHPTAHIHTALLSTNKQICSEAAALLYSLTSFQMWFYGGKSRIANKGSSDLGPIDTLPFLKHVQHLDIRVLGFGMRLRIRTLQLAFQLADAFEVCAKLKTCTVSFQGSDASSVCCAERVVAVVKDKCCAFIHNLGSDVAEDTARETIYRVLWNTAEAERRRLQFRG